MQFDVGIHCELPEDDLFDLQMKTTKKISITLVGLCCQFIILGGLALTGLVWLLKDPDPVEILNQDVGNNIKLKVKGVPSEHGWYFTFTAKRNNVPLIPEMFFGTGVRQNVRNNFFGSPIFRCRAGRNGNWGIF